MGIGVSYVWFVVTCCVLEMIVGCESYLILKYLPNFYKCLGICSFIFTRWYTGVPVLVFD